MAVGITIHTALQMALRCTKVVITKRYRDTQEIINAKYLQRAIDKRRVTEMAMNIFHTWTNVIAYESVGGSYCGQHPCDGRAQY